MLNNLEVMRGDGSKIEKIAQEYELIKKTCLKDLKYVRRVKDYCRVRPNQHHVPGYIIHGWIDGSMIQLLKKDYNIENYFYEPYFAMDFRLPWTRENLGGEVVFEYSQKQVKLSDRRYLVIVQWDVKVSSKDKILTSTFPDKPFTLIGPMAEILFPEKG